MTVPPKKYKPRPCLIIPADSGLPIRVEQAQSCDLASLQKLVGGNIEFVSISRSRVRELEAQHGVKLGGAQLYANEEGLLQGLPVNERATALVEGHTMPIVGDCFVMHVP